MKTGGVGLLAILMALLLAKAGALGCHFKAFPAINQRLSSPPARAPTACATNDPLQKQNNGAIMMPQFGHWLHLHLCIYIIYCRLHAQAQLLYLMCSQRTVAEGEVVVSWLTLTLCRSCIWVGGGAAPGSGCILRAISSRPGGSL